MRRTFYPRRLSSLQHPTIQLFSLLTIFHGRRKAKIKQAFTYPQTAARIVLCPRSPLLAQQQSSSIARVLQLLSRGWIETGVQNRKGHLTLTFPKRLEDSPAYKIFPRVYEAQHNFQATYDEGIFVSYRHSNLLAISTKLTPLSDLVRLRRPLI